jgi:hypothetical protein
MSDFAAMMIDRMRGRQNAQLAIKTARIVPMSPLGPGMDATMRLSVDICGNCGEHTAATCSRCGRIRNVRSGS